MSITQVGSETTGTSGTATTVTPTLSTGWAANDVALIHFTTSSSTQPTATGWTLVVTNTQGNSTSWTFARVLQSGDTNPTFTGSGLWTWAVDVWRGVDTTHPYIGMAWYANATSVSTLTLTGMYCPTPGAKLITTWGEYATAVRTGTASSGGATEIADTGGTTADRYLQVNHLDCANEGIVADQVETMSSSTTYLMATAFFLYPSGWSSGLLDARIDTVSTGTSRSVTIPSGWNAGDIAHIALVIQNTSTPSATGWTSIKSQALSTTSTMWLFRRELVVGDGNPSFTWTGSVANIGGIFVIRNAGNADDVQSISDTVSSSTIAAPSVTFSGSADWLVTLFSVVSTVVRSGTPPSVSTEIAQNSAAVPTLIFNLEKFAAGGGVGTTSTRTETLSGNNANKIAMTLSLATKPYSGWGVINIT
jgi:hypothetical protein